jgi:hypothetical protein
MPQSLKGHGFSHAVNVQRKGALAPGVRFFQMDPLPISENEAAHLIRYFRSRSPEGETLSRRQRI